MKKEQLKELLELYLEGKTTRNEENTLKEYYKGNSDVDNVWFQFIRNNDNPMPEELKQSLSAVLNTKQESNIRIRRALLSAAAVIIVIVSGILFIPRQSDQMNKNQIIATLNEAIGMFEEVDLEREVIYEDEALIIYLK